MRKLLTIALLLGMIPRVSMWSPVPVPVPAWRGERHCVTATFARPVAMVVTNTTEDTPVPAGNDAGIQEMTLVDNLTFLGYIVGFVSFFYLASALLKPLVEQG